VTGVTDQLGLDVGEDGYEAVHAIDGRAAARGATLDGSRVGRPDGKSREVVRFRGGRGECGAEERERSEEEGGESHYDGAMPKRRSFELKSDGDEGKS
jgi:hypothetical protein